MVHGILVMGMRSLPCKYIGFLCVCVCVCACVKFWALCRSDDGLANWPQLVKKGSVTVVHDCIFNVFID